MNPRLLLIALVATATACEHETAIEPTAQTLAGEVAGTYHTNVYLDPSRVALSASQMPYAELKRESDSTVTLLYTKRYPAAGTVRIPNVVLNRQPDLIQLRVADSSIGTLQTDRVFTDNGMEKQGKLLRVSLPTGDRQNQPFTGFK
ncbi:hypothetical protein [Spirosoma rigui]|uniref:hypothetical protein n=1 Tax=Spirosoma rigui TaxID=564064 RepID=UPI0009AFCB1F|nr:hypothetical protein [Spirosoma rigui]